MKIMQWCGSFAIATTLLLGAPHNARAEGDPIEAAKREFDAGKAAFERSEYESALEHFLAAQRIAPAPSLTYNIGLLYERMGRFNDAATTFEKYVEELPAASSKDERDFRDKLKARIKANRQRAQSGTQPPPQPPPTQPTTTQPPPTQPNPNQPPPNMPPPNQPYYGGYPQQQPYYGYQPYTPYGNPYGGYAYAIPQKSPQEKLVEARARRGRAIALLAVGVTLNVVGFGVLGYGLSLPEPGNLGPVLIDFAGVSLAIVGLTLWAPGAASFVRSSKDIALAQKELDKLEELRRTPARQPTTFLFNSPTLTF